MSYLHAIALGIIQGLTEFLPISSSGHLAVVQEWFGYQSESPEMMAFDVVSHLGTLAAAAVVFRRPLVKLLASRRHAVRILGLWVAPTVMTAAMCQGNKLEGVRDALLEGDLSRAVNAPSI